MTRSLGPNRLPGEVVGSSPAGPGDAAAPVQAGVVAGIGGFSVFLLVHHLLIAPIWFVVDNGELAFNTGKNTAKGRALARDSRAVICVDDQRPPYSFVQVQGIASISEDPEDLVDIATRTGARYMGADRAEEYGRRNGVPGELVVRLRPTKVLKAFDLAE